MRWRFIDDDVSAKEKSQTQALIDAWWTSFLSNRDSFESAFKNKIAPGSGVQASPPDVKALKAISEHLMWECSSPSANNYHLVITCEDQIELRSMVAEIIQRAPKLSNWTFAPYREAERAPLVAQCFEARFRDKVPSDLELTLLSTPGNKINLDYRSARFKGKNDGEDITSCMMLSSILFGEEALEKWIGYILTSEIKLGWKTMLTRMTGKQKVSPDKYENWQREFIGIQSEVSAKRPQKYVAELLNPEDKTWSVLGIKAESIPPGESPPERISWITQLPDVVLGKMNNLIFNSENFSEKGELFACLKSQQGAENMDSLSEQEDRERFFDELNLELRNVDAGCAFGTGRGLVNRYWDVCLTDVSKAIPIMKTLVARRNQKDVQLIFYDNCLRDEYITISSSQPED